MKLGSRMKRPDWLDDTELIERLQGVSTATLTTQLLKRGYRSRFVAGAKPLKSGTRMVGAARTMRYVPMREDIDTLDSLGDPSNVQRTLIEDIHPGEVLVIDGMQRTDAGSLGSILALRLQMRGAAGVVTDGAFRDTPGIRNLAIPAFARTQNANTNITIYHPADSDRPIGCGGVYVEPGDAVLGDDEGVVVIPAALVTQVAADAFEQELRESYIIERVKGGMALPGLYPMSDETRAAYLEWTDTEPEG